MYSQWKKVALVVAKVVLVMAKVVLVVAKVVLVVAKVVLVVALFCWCASLDEIRNAYGISGQLREYAQNMNKQIRL